MLRPLVYNIPTYIKDSDAFIKILETKSFPPETTFMAADVESLYPSIDIDEGLRALEQEMIRGKWDHNKIKQTLLLTKWVLRNNVAEFYGKTYLPLQGTAMGTPCAVVFACLFMTNVENQVERQLQIAKQPLPILIKRFIDDYLIAYHYKSQCELFLHKLNNMRTNIKVTASISDQQAIFLDLLIYKGPRLQESNRLDIRLYEKPINKFLYLPGTSYHPHHVNRSWIQNSTQRIRLRNTEDCYHTSCITNLRDRLTARGHNIDNY